ncbi:unnamed protein product, partial [Prunus brigantina]
MSKHMSQLRKENEELKFELDLIEKREIDFTIGAEKVDKMLNSGKNYGNKTGLGFTSETKKNSGVNIRFVKALESADNVDKKNIDLDQSRLINTENSYQSTVETVRNTANTKNFIPVCHFCNEKGHIRPYCFKLKERINSTNLQRQVENLSREVEIILGLLKPKIEPPKRVWLKKEKVSCLVVLTALSVRNSNTWYFDSGCSRHMTGDKNLFLNLSLMSELGSVTFGDGGKSRILGKGTISAPGIDKLENVMYVENLTSNLISISQLCDQDMYNVSFTKDRCNVLNKDGKIVLSGLRSSDNCYCVVSKALSPRVACNLAIDNSLVLWHQRLGHVNLKDLENLSKKEIVRGIPKFGNTTKFVCSGCQLGKQTRT